MADEKPMSDVSLKLKQTTEELAEVKEALKLARKWVWRDPEKHTNHPEQAQADIQRVDWIMRKWGVE